MTANECAECGVGSRGAFLLTVDGKTLCQDCVAPGECDRCGRETDETTLSGEWRCSDCQGARRDQHETRDANQYDLGEWSE